MKVIDLLNKIANGEEVPKKLRLKDELYKDLYYQYNERYNCYDLLGKNLKAGCYVFGYSELNDELEIIEDKPKENKKILEELQTYKDSNNEIYLDNYCYKYMPINKDSLSFNEQVIVDKINEIIDKINGE